MFSNMLETGRYYNYNAQETLELDLGFLMILNETRLISQGLASAKIDVSEEEEITINHLSDSNSELYKQISELNKKALEENI